MSISEQPRDRQGNRRFLVRWVEPGTGTHRSRTFRRKIDAQQFEATVKADIHRGRYIAPTRITWADYVADWLARQTWRPTTRAAVENNVGPDGHAGREWNPRRLTDISRADIERLLANVDLAPGSRRLLFQHVRQVFVAAHRDGLILRAPTAGMRVQGAPDGAVVPPTPGEVEAIRTAGPAWMQVAVDLGIALGVRQGEATGLTVDRVSFTDRTVRIDRQLNRTNELGPPKTPSAHRTIPAPDWLLDEIRDGAPRRAGPLVSIDGTEHVEHNTFGAAWRKARAAAGLDPAFRFHHLRHRYASELLAAGVSIRALSDVLGHTDASTTLRVYSHLLPSDHERIRDAAQALRP